MFEDQPVEVGEADLPGSTDRVLLIEEGDVIASSPLGALRDAILLVNSDLFVTGSRELPEIELPAVIEGLDGIEFRLRGYPEAHAEKLLLILISRAIERRAWEGGGPLRSSFQSLKRIEDETGTRQVYRRLDEASVDVHVYGRPGWTPPPTSTITAHASHDADLAETWVVVYTPRDEERGHAALLAIEEGTNEWIGFWTYRPSLVTELAEYIRRRF